MTMLRLNVTGRLLALAGMFLVSAAALGRARVDDRVPSREPLRDFPMRIGGWTGQASPGFDTRVLEILGADEYITRVYRNASAAPVDLYIGYYESQRAGHVIHSPLNCLPGAGWRPVQSERVRLLVPASVPTAPGHARRDITINRLIVQKGEDHLEVFYWYQGRGRVTASEYKGKLFMALDALRLHRTDEALIRVMGPVTRDGAAALGDAAAFIEAVFPFVNRYIPS